MKTTFIFELGWFDFIICAKLWISSTLLSNSTRCRLKFEVVSQRWKKTPIRLSAVYFLLWHAPAPRTYLFLSKAPTTFNLIKRANGSSSQNKNPNGIPILFLRILAISFKWTEKEVSRSIQQIYAKNTLNYFFVNSRNTLNFFRPIESPLEIMRSRPMARTWRKDKSTDAMRFMFFL